MNQEIDLYTILDFIKRSKYYLIGGIVLSGATIFVGLWFNSSHIYFKTTAQFHNLSNSASEDTTIYRKISSVMSTRVEKDDFQKWAQKFLKKASDQTKPSDRDLPLPVVSVQWGEETSAIRVSMLTLNPIDDATSKMYAKAVLTKIQSQMVSESKLQDTSSSIQAATDSAKEFIETEIQIQKLIEQAGLLNNPMRVHLDRLHGTNAIHSLSKDLVILEQKKFITKNQSSEFLKKLYIGYAAVMPPFPTAPKPAESEGDTIQKYLPNILEQVTIVLGDERTLIQPRDYRFKLALLSAAIFMAPIFLALFLFYARIKFSPRDVLRGDLNSLGKESGKYPEVGSQFKR